MLKWFVNSGWWLGNRHSRESRKPHCCHPGPCSGIVFGSSGYLQCLKKFFRVILSGAARRSRRISLVLSLSSLVLITACTDYVSQIEDRYGEWNVGQVYVPAEVTIGSITDTRDGQSYKTVTIGTQTWMAQNLNYETANSYCYNDNASNCTKYGRLYTWAAATSACPSGWHLPTQTEWNTLFTAVGGQSTAGNMLKSTNGWYSSNGTDAYSFSALPAGTRDYNGDYYIEGNFAYFWSSTESDDYDAYRMYLSYDYDPAYLDRGYKYYGFSVRCVKGKTTEKTSSSNKEKMSSSSKKVESSSSITPKSSSSNKNVVSSSSSGAKGSSSSVSRSSSSSFIWEPSSSSSSSESIFIPPSSSSVAVSPSLTDGGTCAPVYAIVESGEKVIWKYTVGGIVKTTDMLSAIFKWTTPGGSPESLEGKGAKYMSDSVTYATSGQHKATLILSTMKDSFNLTCEPVQVNPSSSSIAPPMSSSSSSITQKLSSSSSKNVIQSSSDNLTSSTSSPTSSSIGSSSSDIPSSSSVSQSVVDPSTVVVGNVTDSRDGQSYKTVTIGSQIWMAQNLNYETENSYCNEDDPSNCTKYGRLYTWGAAMDSVGLWSANGKGCGNGVTCSPTNSVRGVCPTGWHLPNNSEWEHLFIAVGGSSTAGKMLRSSDGWFDGDNGMDAYSFAVLPAGFRDYSGKYHLGGSLFIWSSSENGSYGAYYSYYDKEIAGLQYYGKSYAFSVRCVKDE